MSLLELLQSGEDTLFQRGTLNGVFVAIVTNNVDPDGLGRVKLRFPWLGDEHETDWARIAAPMAGGGRGLVFLPEVDDEVLVAFGHGDIHRPFVLGGLWNGVDTPPYDNGDEQNNLRVIHSRSGHVIRLDDSEGSEKIEILGKDGKDRLVIDAAQHKIEITSDTDVEISAPNGAVSIECKEFRVAASSSAGITSDQSLEVEAGATLTLKGSTVNIN